MTALGGAGTAISGALTSAYRSLTGRNPLVDDASARVIQAAEAVALGTMRIERARQIMDEAERIINASYTPEKAALKIRQLVQKYREKHSETKRKRKEGRKTAIGLNRATHSFIASRRNKLSAANVATAEVAEKGIKTALKKIPAGYELKFIYDMTLPTEEIQPLLLSIPSAASAASIGLDADKTAELQGEFIKRSKAYLSDELRDALVAARGPRDDYSFEYNHAPQLNPYLDDAVKDTYDIENKIEDIPLYLVFYTEHPQHLSLMVFYAGNLYSVGFGYLGAKMSSVSSEILGVGAFYNPDYLIKPSGRNRFGKPHKYKLVSIGFFTRTHANRIIEVFSDRTDRFSSTLITRTVSIVDEDGNPVLDDTGNPTIVSESKFDSAMIPLKTVYAKTSRGNIGTSYLNCTSFLVYVFSEKIKCRYLKGAFVFEHPAECKAYRPEDTNTVFQDVMYQYFNKKYYDEDVFDYLNFSKPSTIGSLLDAIKAAYWAHIGGGDSRRKTRSHTRNSRRITRRKTRS
jgi:hypothetical protein